MRGSRGSVILVVLILAIGVLAFPALGGASMKAPVGTWAGPTGEPDDDYGVLSIANGVIGEQSAFYVEEITGICGGGPAILAGTATMDGTDVTVIGDFRCAGAGNVFAEDFSINLEYTGTGTMYWGIVDSVEIEWAKACPLKKKDVAKFGPTVTATRGTSADETLGGGGIDVLCGGRGNDILEGDEGIDVLLGGNGKDTISGGDSEDFLNGAGSRDTLWGNRGTDLMIGGFKPDRITGGPGPGDVAIGDGGADTCNAEFEINC